MVANANAMAASAALWIGSAADEFVVTPSGQVGSIGIVTGHMDDTAAREKAGLKRTLIAMPPEKIDGWVATRSDEAHAEVRAQVEELYGMFTADVAKQRRVGIDTVRKWGAKMYTAKQAQANKMVDRIETLDESIRRASRLASLNVGQAAAFAGVSLTDVDDDRAPAALPFAAHTERVLLDVSALHERAGKIRALRVAEGRDLSATHLETLGMIASHLDGARSAIASVLAHDERGGGTRPGGGDPGRRACRSGPERPEPARAGRGRRRLHVPVRQREEQLSDPPATDDPVRPECE